jgi:hypothetical protein
MSGPNGSRVRTLDGTFYCTRQEAEELAQAAYLLATKERLEGNREFALAFEARIKGLEARIAALEPVLGAERTDSGGIHQWQGAERGWVTTIPASVVPTP